MGTTLKIVPPPLGNQWTGNFECAETGGHVGTDSVRIKYRQGSGNRGF